MISFLHRNRVLSLIGWVFLPDSSDGCCSWRQTSHLHLIADIFSILVSVYCVQSQDIRVIYGPRELIGIHSNRVFELVVHICLKDTCSTNGDVGSIRPEIGTKHRLDNIHVQRSSKRLIVNSGCWYHRLTNRDRTENIGISVIYLGRYFCLCNWCNRRIGRHYCNIRINSLSKLVIDIHQHAAVDRSWDGRRLTLQHNLRRHQVCYCYLNCFRHRRIIRTGYGDIGGTVGYRFNNFIPWVLRTGSR